MARMRARSCMMEGLDNGPADPTSFPERETIPEPAGGKVRGHHGESQRRSRHLRLSRTQLLQLLSVMEGELQARENIIVELRSRQIQPQVLEAHYGSAAPSTPMKALQRDGLLLGNMAPTDNVYQTPMAKLDHLELLQRDTYRRMLEQLLLAEQCHRRTVAQLETDRRKHADFICKSDDFTSLLEQERWRLKQLLDQEKLQRAHKEQAHGWQLGRVHAELGALRCVALRLLEERQHLQEQEQQHRRELQELVQALQEAQGQRALELQAQQEEMEACHAREQEEKEAQAAQLRLQLADLTRDLQELQERRSTPQGASQELREEGGASSGGEELEALRKRLLEMQGKDEEVARMEAQCSELRGRLQQEEGRGRELRLRLEELQRRSGELERLEEVLARSRAESARLHVALEGEKGAAKDLAAGLEAVKRRAHQLQATEGSFRRAELLLQDQLKEVKALMSTLVEERLKQEEEKKEELSRRLQAEQSRATEVTERLIEESRRLLKMKAEMEDRELALAEEREQLKAKLVDEEEKSRKLRSMLGGMRSRPEEEELELELRAPREDVRVRELTQEVEELRGRLDQLGAEEGATEEELRLRWRAEESRARGLQAEVGVLREKVQQLLGQEDKLAQLRADHALLRRRLAQEEERAAILGAELEAARRHGRPLRPGARGMADVPLASTAMQTEPPAEEDTLAGFVRRSEREERQLMSSLRWGGNPGGPWARGGGPLHIRVTPEGATGGMARLEITGSQAQDFFSSATIVPTLGLHRPRITIAPPRGWPAAAGGLGRARSPVTITTISRAKPPDDSQGPVSPVSIITVSTSPVTEHRDRATGEAGGGAAEDHKIRIHLGSPGGSGCPGLTVRPLWQGEGGPPRQPSASKMTSSITITPACSAASRPTQALTGPGTVASRIPMATGLKLGCPAALGVSTVTRLESREIQAMRIELRTSGSSPLSGSSLLTGEKS